MNKVFLIGRLVRNPDVRFSSNKNLSISRFTLAVDRGFKSDSTDFITCVAFGKSADFVSKYLVKGTKICLMGRIHTSSYTSGGAKHYNTDVIADSIEFAGAKINVQSNDDSLELTQVDDSLAGDLAFIEN